MLLCVLVESAAWVFVDNHLAGKAEFSNLLVAIGSYCFGDFFLLAELGVLIDEGFHNRGDERL